VAEQLGIEPQAFTGYARRDETRREHLLELRMALGMRTFDGQTRQALSAWLLPVAMGTDKGVVLVETLLEEMRRRQIIIPNLMVVERLAEETRSTARRDTYRAMLHGLTEPQIEGLEGLLRIRSDGEQSWLAWLRHQSKANERDFPIHPLLHESLSSVRHANVRYLVTLLFLGTCRMLVGTDNGAVNEEHF